MRAGLFKLAVSAFATLVAVPASAGETLSYSYDALGRLSKVVANGTINNNQTHSICYDEAGNRTTYKSDSTGAVASCVTVTSNAIISIGDASITEGGVLVFTVTRTGEISSAVSASYATANGTATAGSDYTAKSGTVSFAANETSKTITVATIDDTVDEPSETVLVNLSGATGGATFSDSQGSGTINDNDQPSTITITDASFYALPAHQSVYTCEDITIPEFFLSYQYCNLVSNGYNVYEGSYWITVSIDPGYSITPARILEVESAYYGTGVSP